MHPASETFRARPSARTALPLCRVAGSDRPRKTLAAAETRVLRVVVTEAKALYAEALSGLLSIEADMQVVATLLTDQDLATTVARAGAEVLLLDLDVPGRDGPALCELVSRAAPDCRIVATSSSGLPIDLLEKLRAAAHALVSKHSGCPALLDAIRAAAAGERVLDPALVTGTGRSAHTPTARELELLRHAAHGSSVRELADRLHLSEGTVRNYLSRTMTKLGARNRIEAISIARQAGWF